MEILEQGIVHKITNDTCVIQISLLAIPAGLNAGAPLVLSSVLSNHSLSLVRPFAALTFLLKMPFPTWLVPRCLYVFTQSTPTTPSWVSTPPTSRPPRFSPLRTTPVSVSTATSTSANLVQTSVHPTLKRFKAVEDGNTQPFDVLGLSTVVRASPIPNQKHTSVITKKEEQAG